MQILASNQGKYIFCEISHYYKIVISELGLLCFQNYTFLTKSSYKTLNLLEDPKIFKLSLNNIAIYKKWGDVFLFKRRIFQLRAEMTGDVTIIATEENLGN